MTQRKLPSDSSRWLYHKWMVTVENVFLENSLVAEKVWALHVHVESMPIVRIERAVSKAEVAGDAEFPNSARVSDLSGLRGDVEHSPCGLIRTCGGSPDPNSAISIRKFTPMRWGTLQYARMPSSSFKPCTYSTKIR